MNRSKQDPSLPASLWVLTALLVLCATAAGLGALATSQGMGWYQTLEKPSFSPPNSIFGPVWTLLYVLMALAAFLAWRQEWPYILARLALKLFVLQLALNVLWPAIFFWLRAPGWAFLELLVLAGAILAWLLISWNVSRVAGLLIVPYLAWVIYAGVLNAAIWRLN